MSLPATTVLTTTQSEYKFSGRLLVPMAVCTSGVTGGCTIKVQQRVTEADAWEDNPHITFAPDTHLAHVLIPVSNFSRIVVENATGSTVVKVQVG
jgi:hypothetical protein